MAETHLESWQICGAGALKWGIDFKRNPISVNLVGAEGPVLQASLSKLSELVRSRPQVYCGGRQNSFERFFRVLWVQ